jgi:hypothetical protein
MHVIKRIHPSATVFLGILLAFALPFAHVVESCGSAAVNPTGVELLLGDVKPVASNGEPITAEDRQFADEVEHQSRPFAWFVAVIAFAGLVLALFRRGARWGLCSLGCLVSALALGVALDGDDYHQGYQLVLGLSAGAVVLRLLLAVARRARRPTELDPRVSTAPSEAA